MPNYEINYSVMLPEWGVVTIVADNEEDAANQAREHVEDLYRYEEYKDLNIDKIEEIKQ